MNKKLSKVIFAGIMAAFELIITYFVSIPLPYATGAYVNAGDAILYAGTFCLPGVFSALAAGIGSSLADVLLGASIYALPTFIIKFCMSFVFTIIYRRKNSTKYYLLASLAGGLVMVIGYFLFETALFGAIVAFASLPANLAQCAFGVVISFPLYVALKKSAFAYKFREKGE